MALQTRKKHTSEVRRYAFDFTLTDEIQSGETISSVTSVAADPVDAAMTIGASSISGAQVRFNISGGSDGSKYLITCIIVTSGSKTLTAQGYLDVRAKLN